MTPEEFITELKAQKIELRRRADEAWAQGDKRMASQLHDLARKRGSELCQARGSHGVVGIFEVYQGSVLHEISEMCVDCGQVQRTITLMSLIDAIREDARRREKEAK